jgi:ELWxxDGT repeat protein
MALAFQLVLSTCGLSGVASGQPCLPVSRTWDYSPGTGSTPTIPTTSIATIGKRAAYITIHTNRLLVWDGSNAAGTLLLPPTFAERPTELLGTFAGKFYFLVSGQRLFACNLDGSNPAQILATNSAGNTEPVTVNTLNGVRSPFIEFAGATVFAGSTAATGTELFITDGSAAGTRLLADIVPGTIGSNPSGFAAVRGKLFFYAKTPEFGSEPWITDGTTAGTSLLLDTVPGADTIYTLAGGAELHEQFLYFSGAAYGSMYRTDGTTAGTQAINLSQYLSFGGYTSTPFGLAFFARTQTDCCRVRLLFLNSTGIRELANDLYAPPPAARGMWITRAGPNILFATLPQGSQLAWRSAGTDQTTFPIPNARL